MANYKLTQTGAQIQADLNKIEEINESYATPEQFGAVGDGITDDTNAWQQAVNTGLSVKALHNKYKVGQINVSENIIIDCNNAEFISTDMTVFNCSGTEQTTFTNTTIAKYEKFAVSNTELQDYTGFIYVKGTNNYNPSRSYYYSGFVAQARDGKVEQTFPYEITTPSCKTIKPISVVIKNISNITRTYASTSQLGKSIIIAYGINCVIENVCGNNVGDYAFIDIEKSLNVEIKNCVISMSSNNDTGNSYIVEIMESFNTSVYNCNMYNDKWHCISTGGTIPVFNTIVKDCVLESSTVPAFGDHSNAYNSQVLNTIATNGIDIQNSGVVKDCTIYGDEDTTYKNCMVKCVAGWDDKGEFIVEGVKFNPCSDSNGSYIGVILQTSHGQATDDFDVYFKSISVKNCYCKSETKNAMFAIRRDNGTKLHCGNVLIEHVDGWNINGIENYSAANFDFSNSVMKISNCYGHYSSNYLYGPQTNRYFPTYVVSNSRFYNFRGSCDNLYLDNVILAGTCDIAASNIYATYVEGVANIWKALIKNTTSKLRFTIFAQGATIKQNCQKASVDGVNYVYYEQQDTTSPTALTNYRENVLTNVVEEIPTGVVNWGDIGGTLSNQTDLNNQFTTINNSITGKLDKVTETSTFAQAYTKTATGNQGMMNINENATGQTIPRRDANGQLKVVLTPSVNRDATSKNYVDLGLQDVREVAEGKNKNLVIDDEDDITGTKDSDGNYTNVTAITGITLSTLKIGDNILLKDVNQPDYWVSQLTPSISLHILETAKQKVTDVKVNGTSVLTNGVANISVPTSTEDLTNDSDFITSSYHDTTKLDASKCTLQTTAPTSAITDGGVHIVYLTSEPSTKYDGYIYLIKE